VRAIAKAQGINVEHVTVGVGITDDGTNLISVNQRWTVDSTASLTDPVSGIMQGIANDLQDEGINALYIGPDDLIFREPGTFIIANHAEDYILQTAEELGYNLEGIGASIRVCGTCAPKIRSMFPWLGPGLQKIPPR
jgi:hypothetical protein